jgi:hypothetical protein
MPLDRQLTTLFTSSPGSRNLYLSYLTTDSLVRVVEKCDELLARCPRRVPVDTELLYWDIRDDALLELRGRQLELFKAPASREDLRADARQ